jgi:hypothetical protein
MTADFNLQFQYFQRQYVIITFLHYMTHNSIIKFTDIYNVVSHKLCSVLPKIWSFLSHIFSQVSPNVTVQVEDRVERSVTRNNSQRTIPFMSKKTMSMLFVEHWTCHTLFCSWSLWALPLQWWLLCSWIITINPTFITHYIPRDKSWVLVSLLS